MMDPMPDLTRAYNLISQEVHQRALFSFPTDSVAFQTYSTRPKTSDLPIPPARSAPTQRTRPQCTHCGMMGHTVQKCFKIFGYPPGYKPNSSQPWISGHSSRQQKKFSPQQSSPLVNLVHAAGKSVDHNSGSKSALEQAQMLISQLSSQLKDLSTSATDSADTVPPSNPSGPFSGLDDWQG
ncbi:PREDICTED: uncharacterized protein LOC104804870 [Tarenaya hassleriana]|uniref:uncharacterized protein LOC104804870 n=1 Tax=Tarenaya hassleriana TaxID=28532 RepID=UPI00053C6CED|nr:PREDICTED: uncharacterized protein LOC104804870 [Tarenaya hassleriana]